METGAFAMFDALGIRGIWKNPAHDPGDIVLKFVEIEKRVRKLVDSEFGGPGHPNTQASSNFVKMVRLGFISDTVVIGFVNKDKQHPIFTIMMAARYAGEVARLGLEAPAPWTYRGVITYGQFVMHESGSFFVGPAVDEAAAYYERAEAALIWLAPSARAKLARATSSDFQGAMARGRHDIPLKRKGKLPTTKLRTYVASPFAYGSSPVDASTVSEAMLSTFDLTKRGVAKKHRETKAFLLRLQKDHAKLWRKNQALGANAAGRTADDPKSPP